jgi:lipopolysaccharide export system permease protein
MLIPVLDRQMYFSYVKAYIVCLISLLGLFIVVDLFMNLDDFAQGQKGLRPVLEHIGKYYGYKSTQIFDRLCEAIVLLAGMFTVAWMQRNNELLPLLSAGVSTRRVVRPVLLASCAMLGLSILNQEFVLPSIDSFLVENRANPDGEKEVDVKGGHDRNGILIDGSLAYKRNLLVTKFRCTMPPYLGGLGGIAVLQAKEAVYVPFDPAVKRSGGWLLRESQPPQLKDWNNDDVLVWLGPGRYFLKTDVDFQSVTRPKNWFVFMPTLTLFQEINKPGNTQLASLAVIFHMRLTRPILGMILVLLGLSVILRDQNRNVFISAGMCLVLCGLFFAACFTCQYVGNNEIVSPALAAWLPVFVFGPPSLVMFDAVHT